MSHETSHNIALVELPHAATSCHQNVRFVMVQQLKLFSFCFVVMPSNALLCQVM